MAGELKIQGVTEAAVRCGLHLVAVTDATPLGAEHVARVDAWQRSGQSGGKRYLARPGLFRADPTRVIPGAQAIITVALPYYQGLFPPATGPGFGRVARYAWGKDYHKVLPKRLMEFHRCIEELAGFSIPAREATDATPLLERALAARAGLGFIGRNTLLIRPRLGSFFLLAELILSMPITQSRLAVVDQKKPSCGSCTRCLTSCPTNAIDPAGFVDARRCISYLTIERTGYLEPWEREALGDWLFGCDLCQECCPFNHRAQKGLVQSDPAMSSLPEFDPSQGVGPWVSLTEVLAMTTRAQFEARFAGTPLLRARRAGLVRNALCVARNTGYAEALPQIEFLATHDPSPVIRETALWAMEGLR